MEKFSVVIVTYNPNKASLSNIEKIANLCPMVIIVDNSGHGKQPKSTICENIIILENNDNIGLAAALNKGVIYAGELGFENIFLLDQDTQVNDDYFINMLNFQKGIYDNECAFCVPDFFDRNSLTNAMYPILKKLKFQRMRCPKIEKYVHGRMLQAITSGTLITYSRFLEIGSFKEALFIDFVDNEYCLRAFVRGFYIAINCNAVINHAIGTRTIHKILGLTIKPNHHNHERRYYIARNGIRIAIDYFPFFHSYAVLILLILFHEFVSILLFENKKKIKIKAIIFGIFDGFTGRLGYLPPSV